MAVNEVIYNGETLIDLKSDTVTAETLAEGVTAHDASGEKIVGTMSNLSYVAQPTAPENTSLLWVDTDDDTSSDEGNGTTNIESIDAEKVLFSEDLVTTYEIGNILLENGQAIINAKGRNLKQVWESIFVRESNPETTPPSISLVFSQAKSYEVGTKIIPSYSASLNPGSYTYGPDTGVQASGWDISDTIGNSSNTSSGSFPELEVVDGISYKITAKATHTEGAIPITNLGNEYPDNQIVAGTKSSTSEAVTGYRNSFYGTLEEKSDITSSVIRSLKKSNKALSNGSSFTITVPVGALRVIVAYPSTLRDITSIKDVNGLNAEISSGFSKSTANIEGNNGYTAIEYKLYIMDFANANDKDNKFTVTI